MSECIFGYPEQVRKTPTVDRAADGASFHIYPMRSSPFALIRAATGAAVVIATITTVSGAAAAPAPQLPTDSLSTAADKGRILGSDKAPIWMLVVSDFQCPFCRQWHTETWESLRKEYVATGKVRVAFVHFPLGMHANARAAAIAAMCASAQGRFWPVADAIFKAQDRWKDLKDARPYFDSLARSAGLDAARQKG